MQKSFHTPGPVSLYVEVGSGGVTVHTDDVTETVVDVNGKNAEDVIVEQRGDEVVVVAARSTCFFGRSHDLDIHVAMPSDSRLDHQARFRGHPRDGAHRRVDGPHRVR